MGRKTYTVVKLFDGERPLNSGNLISDYPDHLLVQGPQPCMICKQPTRWVEIHFEGPLHPSVCTARMWEDYEAAEQKAGPIAIP